MDLLIQLQKDCRIEFSINFAIFREIKQERALFFIEIYFSLGWLCACGKSLFQKAHSCIDVLIFSWVHEINQSL